ncbi:MAG: hypothetical protein M3346_10710 [Actinomycetota bacterium]|nr:hypothetical protein [Actinomycetota bacterium]
MTAQVVAGGLLVLSAVYIGALKQTRPHGTDSTPDPGALILRQRAVE